MHLDVCTAQLHLISFGRRVKRLVTSFEYTQPPASTDKDAEEDGDDPTKNLVCSPATLPGLRRSGNRGGHTRRVLIVKVDEAQRGQSADDQHVRVDHGDSAIVVTQLQTVC
jgi:hypothetical protein